MTRRLAVSLPAGTITPVAAPGTSAVTDPADTIADSAANEPSIDPGTAPDASAGVDAPATSARDVGRTAPPQQQSRGLLLALLLALLADLNLMPA